MRRDLAGVFEAGRTFSAPAAPQTFADEDDRARLSAVAIKAFRRVGEAWGLTNAQSAALLGVSQSTWERIKRGARGVDTLSQDQLTRASALIGVFRALSLLFADAMAVHWPALPNRGPVYGGLTPLEAMIRGGIPVMLEVRRQLDAVRGGL
jgi:hypothetical protein